MSLKTLLDVVSDWNPRMLPNGQIKMRCVFRENHDSSSDGSSSLFLNPERGTYHCFSCKAKGGLAYMLTNRLEVPYFEAMSLVGEHLLGSMEGKEKVVFEIEEPWELGKVPAFYRSKGIAPKILARHRVGETREGWMAIPFYLGKEMMGVQYRKDGEKDRFMKNNPGFERSKFIYNYNPLLADACLVEGYTDVWKLEMCGDHAEALLGVSFSKDQAELIAVHETVWIALDNDEAGRRATELVAYRMQHYDTQLMVIPYLGKDPGAVMSGRAWREFKEHATSYAEYTAEMSVLNEQYLDKKMQWWKEFKKSDES